MTQARNFIFGVDNVSFIDSDFNVYAVDDPQTFTVNLTYEKTDHRGGANNDIRASAIHSRSGEVSLGTGYVDLKLAQLLTGGTITSLGTSPASITTGSASGVNTLGGTTATIPAGISTITINSATLVKSTDYYIRASENDKIIVTRVEDGKQFSEVTLTNSVSGIDIDSDRGIQASTTASATSLTIDEVGYLTARSTINTINSKIAFDDNKPGKLTMRTTVDYNGYRRIINVPVVQPSGSIVGNSASEFQIQDLTMGLENSQALNELADIVLEG